MKLFSQPKPTLLACLLGGISAFALGCVITVGESTDAGTEEKCGDLLTHSFEENGVCYCEVGYEWCNPNDPSDYDCCGYPPKPGSCDQPHNTVVDNECFCEAGYTWCNPDNADDYSCCKSDQGGSTGTDSTSGTGTDSTSGGTTDAETGDLMCDSEYVAPPDTCNPDDELAYCTTLSEMCVGESEYFTCDTNGTWVPADGDADCQFSGYDFSYGCVWEGDVIDQLCGTGPGTPCADNDPDSCVDSDMLNYCLHSKLTAVSCLTLCTETGIEGVMYDFGSCGEQEGEFKCLCCDFDDPNCGTDSGSTGSSTTGG